MKNPEQTESSVLTMPLADSTSATSQINQEVSESDISRRAYERFLARGSEHGHDLDDWLEAERELQPATSQVA
ncbi:MAG TPA: DUF2934 domain-containing protein [Vicinamibacterales bacterium]|nr:DUF2934 domain-containing protein [Vicinamibacterales bacterium]